jgi:hypothetical protein
MPVLSAQRRTAALVVRAEAAGADEKTVVIGLAADSGAARQAAYIPYGCEHASIGTADGML